MKLSIPYRLPNYEGFPKLNFIIFQKKIKKIKNKYIYKCKGL